MNTATIFSVLTLVRDVLCALHIRLVRQLLRVCSPDLVAILSRAVLLSTSPSRPHLARTVVDLCRLAVLWSGGRGASVALGLTVFGSDGERETPQRTPYRSSSRSRCRSATASSALLPRHRGKVLFKRESTALRHGLCVCSMSSFEYERSVARILL